MKSSFTFSLLLICGLCFGQNLVPNPSFEEHDTCPSVSFQINRASHWTSPSTGSPDYYNDCNNSNQFCSCGVPTNGAGFQVAHSGTAYTGIAFANYHNYANVNANYREYLQTQLTDSLTAGINYCIRFYVSAGDSFNYISNDIGVYFSKFEIHDTCYRGCPLPYTPQFENTSVLDDRIGWTEVSGIYLATGGEKFIVIGNFKDSIETVTTYTGWYKSKGGFPNTAYYYVDDICVSTDSLACNTTVGIKKLRYTDVEIFPNPFSNQLTFSLASNEPTTISLYDFLGQQILQQTFTNSTTINTAQMQAGIYFYELRNAKGTLKTGRVVRE